MLRDLQFDPLKLQQLAEHYQMQLDMSYDVAEAQVHQHINRIIRIFDSVDQRLAAIDDFRYQLEKRVADTVRYMDKTTPGMAARLSRLIAAVSNLPEKVIPPLTTLDEVGFISPASVRAPVRRRVEAQRASSPRKRSTPPCWSCGVCSRSGKSGAKSMWTGSRPTWKASLPAATS